MSSHTLAGGRPAIWMLMAVVILGLVGADGAHAEDPTIALPDGIIARKGRLNVENAATTEFHSQRAMPALRVDVAGHVNDGENPGDAAFRIYEWTPNKPDTPVDRTGCVSKPDAFDRSAPEEFVKVKLAATERDNRETTVYYLHLGLAAIPGGLAEGAKLFVIYRLPNSAVWVTQAEPTEYAPPTHLAAKAENPYEFTKATLAPEGGPVTVVDVSPQPTLPATPPLTPPDRPAVSLGTAPQSNDKADVLRVKLDSLSLQDVLRVPGWGRTDLTLRGTLSSHARDPEAGLEAEVGYRWGLRAGRGTGLRRTALPTADEGIFFTPRLRFLASQSYIVSRGEDEDNRRRYEVSPLRLSGVSRSLFRTAPGTYVNGDDGRTSLSLDLSLLDLVLDEFSRNALDESGTRLGGLNPRGFLTPCSLVEGKLSWSVSPELGLSLVASGYWRQFWRSRDRVVENYFHHVGSRQVPFDVPHFSNYTHDFEIALERPKLSLMGILKDATIRVGWRKGFPAKAGFYDIFATSHDEFFLAILGKELILR